jgi:hypothetical protein
LAFIYGGYVWEGVLKYEHKAAADAYLLLGILSWPKIFNSRAELANL